ncbi:ASCH domain-containing protein [Streptomyces sp. AC495_CC817]|uniref:ASCH domain-containing protein n=1 Tax=Streptomyces sp. AC495_CC817 TaxID=2823900 RepID=UPI001C271E6A|nr:ASCH domain-containing protein [Streptomyces sp. AC495_CC817]
MDNLPIDRDAALHAWTAYKLAHPDLAIDTETPPFEYFGDNPELTEELVSLVRSGVKRATAALAAEFIAEGQPLPRIGSHWVACDSQGRPAFILRTTELRIGTVASADERFAFDEGEDDRTLESWRAAHRQYWARQCRRLRIDWDEDALPVVFERFEVAWAAESDPA